MKRIIYFAFLFLAVSYSCRKPQPLGDAIYGLASPVNLQIDTTRLYIQDYFQEIIPDSFQAPPGLSLEWEDSILTLVTLDGGPAPISVLKTWIKGIEYDIVLKRSRKMVFHYAFDPKGVVYTQVNIAGDINNWNPVATRLVLKDGLWETDVVMDPGIYHYQVVVDGKWMLDPGNPDIADNNLGGFNSLMHIGDPSKEEGPQLSTFSFDEKEIVLECRSDMEGLGFIALLNNQPLNEFEVDSGPDVAKIKIMIPRSAKKVKRSYIRVFPSNSKDAGNDLLIPLDYGKVVTSAKQLDRNDYEAAVMYFVMTDRWFDGNPNNNPKPLNGVLPAADYHGGDLSGILAKMKEGWFENMGVNTIWISPTTKGPDGAYGQWPSPETKFAAYHGYWPVSSSQVDPRIGDEAVLMELIDEAHRRNINILFDWVANHVHEQHPLLKDHPDWITSLYLPDGTLNVEKWDEQRLTTWFDIFLPTLDLSRPEVYQSMSDSAVLWLYKYKADGFRHDATKHIPEVYWRTLTKKVKVYAAQNQHRIYQIGETFGSRDLIGSYVGSGMLDAQFDFSLYFDARNVFAVQKESFNKLNLSLLQSFRAYGYHHVMGNITGNHDMGRFTSYAGGGLTFSEDPKQAGWSRNVEVGDTLGYYRMAQLMTFIMTIPGIPVVYYGDEFGMPGGADPDNRRMMKFNGLNSYESKLLKTSEMLAKNRREHLSLIYGDFKVLMKSDSTFAYERSWFGERSIVLYNKSASSVTFGLKRTDSPGIKDWHTLFGTAVDTGEEKLTITLKPYTSEIITNKPR